MRKKLDVIVEKAEDGQLWGRIQYGEDLLTTNAKALSGLIKIFRSNLGLFME